MRKFALAILALGTLSAGPASAQTYDRNFPVCLRVYGPLNYYECNYVSLGQCAVSASGRAAQCVTNPFFANAYEEPRRYRRQRHAY